jgi:hypothetical protein
MTVTEAFLPNKCDVAERREVAVGDAGKWSARARQSTAEP